MSLKKHPPSNYPDVFCWLYFIYAVFCASVALKVLASRRLASHCTRSILVKASIHWTSKPSIQGKPCRTEKVIVDVFSQFQGRWPPLTEMNSLLSVIWPVQHLCLPVLLIMLRSVSIELRPYLRNKQLLLPYPDCFSLSITCDLYFLYKKLRPLSIGGEWKHRAEHRTRSIRFYHPPCLVVKIIGVIRPEVFYLLFSTSLWRRRTLERL